MNHKEELLRGLWVSLPIPVNNKEYTLRHIGDPTMIQGRFLNKWGFWKAWEGVA